MMAYSKLPTTIFISLAVYLLVTQVKQQASAAPGITANTENTHRSRSRPFVRLANRPYLRIKPELNDFIADDDDFYELNKRQTSDDYGHLRFGKRDEFDDYGHMRFGRSSSDNNNNNNNNARK